LEKYCYDKVFPLSDDYQEHYGTRFGNIEIVVKQGQLPCVCKTRGKCQMVVSANAMHRHLPPVGTKPSKCLLGLSLWWLPKTVCLVQ